MHNLVTEKYAKTIALFGNSINNAIALNLATTQLAQLQQLQVVPASIIELQNTLGKLNIGISKFYSSIEALQMAAMPALTYLQDYHYELYSQVHRVLPRESLNTDPIPNPHCKHKRKINIIRAHKLLLKSTARKVHASWDNLSESKFSMILVSIDRLLNTVDEPMHTQLNILVFLLTVLFIYTHTPNDAPSKEC